MNSRVVLPIDCTKAAFPEFRKILNSGRSTIAAQLDLSALPIYEFEGDTNKHHYFHSDGRDYLLPGLQPSKKVAYINWDSNSAFLDYLLRQLQKSDALRPGAQLHDVSRATLNRLRRRIKTAEIINSTKEKTRRSDLAGIIPSRNSSTGRTPSSGSPQACWKTGP